MPECPSCAASTWYAPTLCICSPDAKIYCNLIDGVVIAFVHGHKYSHQCLHGQFYLQQSAYNITNELQCNLSVAWNKGVLADSATQSAARFVQVSVA